MFRFFSFRKIIRRKIAVRLMAIHVVLNDTHAIVEFLCCRFFLLFVKELALNWSICVQSMCMLFFFLYSMNVCWSIIISTYRSFTCFFSFFPSFYLKLTLFPRGCFCGYRICFAIFLTIWYRGYDRFNNHRICGRFGRVPERGEVWGSYIVKFVKIIRLIK